MATESSGAVLSVVSSQQFVVSGLAANCQLSVVNWHCQRRCQRLVAIGELSVVSCKVGLACSRCCATWRMQI